MKRIIYSILAVVCISTMAACSSNEDISSTKNIGSKKVRMTFTASHEGSDTRAAIGKTNTENGITTTTIVWQAGDKISIYDGTNINEFTLEGNGGSKTGIFTGEADPNATKYLAVFPANMNMTYSDEKGGFEGVDVMMEQVETPNSFYPKSSLMMAQSEDGKLNFKNAVGFIKVTPKFDCTSIVLSSANQNTKLAGSGVLKYNNGKPYVDIPDDGDYSKLWFVAPGGDQMIEANKSYYIAVNPCTLEAGWSLEFTSLVNSEFIKRLRVCNTPLTIERSKVINLGEFDVDGDYWYDEHRGIVNANQEVDLGLTITKDNKTYKVIFAKSNLAATGLAENETDFGDYFAWGATEPWYTSYSQDNGSMTFSWKTGKTKGYTSSNCPSYNDDSYVEKNVLKLEYDAAHKILGGDWQLPSQEIWNALAKANQNIVNWGANGEKALDTINGIQGMKISKKDDSSTCIFLPTSGYILDINCVNISNYGHYWSGTAVSSTKSYNLYIGTNNYVNTVNDFERSTGFSIRPVRLEEIVNN